MVITRAPAARAWSSRPAGTAAPPSRIAAERGQAPAARPSSSGAAGPGPGRRNCAARGRGCAVPGPGGRPPPGSTPASRDRTNSRARRCGWAAGRTASACPVRAPSRARLARAECAQRRGAELDTFGLAGGAGGGDHDRRAVGQVQPGARRGRAGASGRHRVHGLAFPAWPGEGAQQRGDLARRQARVQREERRDRCRPAPPPARRAGARLGAGREQECVQGTSGHQRKVNGRKSAANREGRRDRVAAAGTPAVSAGPG